MTEYIELWSVVIGVVLTALFAVVGYLHKQNLRDHKDLAEAVDDVRQHLNRQDAAQAATMQQITDRSHSTDQRFTSMDKKLDRGAGRMDDMSDKLGSVAEAVAYIKGQMGKDQ